MSTLSDITKRLEELPEQKKLKTLTNDVQTLTTRLVDIRAKLTDASDRRGNAQIVFPEEAFNKTATAVRAAARQAANLKGSLENDFSEVGSRATEEKVTRLGDRAKQAEADLLKTWPDLLRHQLKSYEAIAEVATNLPGGAVLAEIMQRLQQHVDKPPATKQAAETICEDLTALRESVENLGLEGEAGRFLIEAAKGTADPRDLFIEEIKKYFDEKGLWHVLAVTIK